MWGYKGECGTQVRIDSILQLQDAAQHGLGDILHVAAGEVQSDVAGAGLALGRHCRLLRRSGAGQYGDIDIVVRRRCEVDDRRLRRLLLRDRTICLHAAEAGEQRQ
ncbi:hypothetical protein E6W36_11865 [Hankyongella ginsenosidimutans]|uniref:Uncharacterized protein n=1 Tax=Hankyongella ginsenosidimutans TaxID=1763828 RepID=A0A4D7C7I2_9SPHN|nr:hypothetical protein [Hankyongella ginsenosidimutans]QCI79955.1 hypothetical protein E6W36_11865 [Hankyongella ginsenosidimutans]